jgi:transposase, IS30 family
MFCQSPLGAGLIPISAMLAVFGRIDPHLRRSITFDNDTAFAQHSLLRTMRDMTTWFCDAYASWQKGGVENANGRYADGSMPT